MPDNALISVLFSMAMGFVAAGICTSSYSLLTNSRLRFAPPEGGERRLVWRIGLLAVGGPLIIMRNAVKAARMGLRHKGWLVATALIASGWSFCLGLAVINLLVVFGALRG